MTKIQLNNVYVISALATIGGLIQGFDVSSMSAIIGTSQVCFDFDWRPPSPIPRN